MVTKLLAYGANMEVINMDNEKTIFEQLTYLGRSYLAEGPKDKQNKIDMIKVFYNTVLIRMYCILTVK